MGKKKHLIKKKHEKNFHRNLIFFQIISRLDKYPQLY